MRLGGLGVDHSDGALHADAEAVGFRALNKGLWAAEFEFLEPVLRNCQEAMPSSAAQHFALVGVVQRKICRLYFPRLSALAVDASRSLIFLGIFVFLLLFFLFLFLGGQGDLYPIEDLVKKNIVFVQGFGFKFEG